MFQPSYVRSASTFKKIALAFCGVGLMAGFFMYIFLSNSSNKAKASIGSSTQLAFSPPLVRAVPHQQFQSTINFKKENTQHTFQGYALKVVFDKTKLRVDSVEYLIGTVSDGLGYTNANTDVINSSGEIKLQGEINNASPYIFSQNSDSPIVNITYTVIASNLTTTDVTVSGKFIKVNADYSLDYEQVDSTTSTSTFTVADPSITLSPSPSTSPDPTVTCIPAPVCNPMMDNLCILTPPAGVVWCPQSQGNTVLNMKLKLQGIPTQPRVTTPLVFSVDIVDAKTKKVGSQKVSFLSDTNGIWNGAMKFDLPVVDSNDMNYSLYVKGPKHLRKRVCEITPKESSAGTYACATNMIKIASGSTTTVDMSGIYQMVGDLPVDSGVQNGVVDASDTSYIRLHFGETTNAVLQVADLNMDGVVDTQDFSLVLAALSIKYDDP